MRLAFYHILCILLLTVSFTCRSFGQIININADTVVITSQVSTDSSIYVFYTNNTGSLKARCPVPGPAAFEWFAYDTINHVFNTDVLSTDSVLANLSSGGYQVHVTAPGFDNRYTAWVYVDSLSVTITNKDKYGSIKYNSYTCDYTDLFATARQSKFIYYNTLKQKDLIPTVSYIWSSNPAIPIYSSDNSNWLRVDTSRLPLEKATFYVQVKDNFGATSKTDPANYSPIIAKAIIAPPVYDKSHVVGDKNSAPMKVSFGNLSKNSVSFTWYISKIDTIPMTTLDSVHWVFKETGTYNVKLLAQSLELCTDTTHVEIDIAKGEIGDSKDSSGLKWPELPNYFSPDGEYPYFKIYNISIRHFRITIYSRWGKKVYEYEGDDMLNGWKGWDGTIGSSKASAGIYFYVLEVMSWDKVPDKTLMNPKGQYSGYFYLFRNQ